MSKEEREPKRQFRGTWTPVELFLALERGEIGPSQFTFLNVVESFVNARGVGYYGSYELLGKKMGGLSVRRIRQLVNELVELGFLVWVKSKNKGETLKTSWSNAGRRKQKGRQGRKKISAPAEENFREKEENFRPEEPQDEPIPRKKQGKPSPEGARREIEEEIEERGPAERGPTLPQKSSFRQNGGSSSAKFNQVRALAIIERGTFVASGVGR